MTTSGTAVANLHPAVLEARTPACRCSSLTADRPPQLLGTGANQTIDQPGIFGGAVRLALSAGPASDPERENGPWRAAVGRAVAAAARHTARPGARSTCPSPNRWCPTGERLRRVGPAARRGPRWPGPRVQAAPLPLDPAAPTLVIAGAGAPSEVRDWGLPVVAEPASRVWAAGVRAGPVAARRAPGRSAPGPGRGRRPPDPAPPGAAAARRPAGRRLRPRRPGGPQLAGRRRDRPRRRGRAVMAPAAGLDGELARRRPRGGQGARRRPRRPGSARRPAAGPGAGRRAAR